MNVAVSCEGAPPDADDPLSTESEGNSGERGLPGESLTPATVRTRACPSLLPTLSDIPDQILY